MSETSSPDEKKPMAPVGKFNELSDDVLNVVIDHIVANSDLVSLLYTNKRNYGLCLRKLYRVAVITVGGGYDDVYVPMLNAKNKGLEHIRILDVGIDTDNLNDGSYRQSQFVLGMLFEVLPPDVLEEFIWRSWRPLTPENVKRLYRTQRKLKYLESGAIEPAFQDKMLSDWRIDSAFDHAEELGFFLESKAAMQLSNEMLKRMKNPIKKMFLNTHMGINDEPDLSDDEVCDSSVRPGVLTATVFSHLLPFGTAKPLRLEELAFNEIFLRHPRDTFCKIFDFANLTRLVIEKCKGGEVLLAELCRSTLLPTNLKGFHFLHSEQTTDDEALKSLEDFLSLLTGLKELAIDLQHGSRMPAIGKILRHAKTLKILSVHVYSEAIILPTAPTAEEEHHYNLEDFQSLCAQCTELEELSVAFPEHDICESNHMSYWSYKQSLISPSSKLDNLYTLQITTWPTASNMGDEVPRSLYDAMLKVRAMEFFKARETMGKLKKLHLVEWGTEGCFHRSCIASGTSSTIFVRSTENSPDGRVRVSCSSVVPDWRQSKLSLPTDVLAVALAKHRLPPAMVRYKEEHDGGNAPIGWKQQKQNDGDHGA